MLIVLGLFAWQQMPVELAAGAGTANIATTSADTQDSGDSEADAGAAEGASSDTETTQEVSGGTGAPSDAPSDTAPDTDDSAAEATQVPDELVVAFTTGSCSACHTIPNITGASGQIGPDLSTIGTVAANRIPGKSAEDYIRQSLLEPGAYIAPECPAGPCEANVMVASFIRVLSQDQIDSIIDYLLTLTDETAMPPVASGGAETAETTDTKQESSSETESATEGAEAADMEAVTAAVIKGTCGACHVIPGVDSAVGVIGPDLTTIGHTAATRIEGYTAAEYLTESIYEPNAYIAPECPTGDCLPGIMLANLSDLLTQEEIELIVNYLLTLDGQGQ